MENADKSEQKLLKRSLWKRSVENADKSEQKRKTYLIGIVNELTTILPKADNQS